MGLLVTPGGYDPVTAVVNKATDTLQAMTAFDTTNLRRTFTAPANGCVNVRLKCLVETTSGTYPRILLGVLDGSTIRLRMSPIGATMSNGGTARMVQEVSGVISGLTPGNSYSLDAAWGVEIVIASTNIKYGGPDDASGADAWGAFEFEVWSAAGIMGTPILYDPASAVTKSGTALRAMTVVDGTNLSYPFTTNASGLGSTAVLWRQRTQYHGSTTAGQYLLGIINGASTTATGVNALNSSTFNVAATAGFQTVGSFIYSGTVVTYTGKTSTSFTGCSNHAATTGGEAVTGGVLGRSSPAKATPTTSVASACEPLEAQGIIDHLEASTSYTFNAAYAVQTVCGAGSGIKYGGPDNATTNDAFGAYAFEIWQA